MFCLQKEARFGKSQLLRGAILANQNKNKKGGKFQNLSTFFTEPTHYSKSQIFVQKFNFDKTPTFSRVFHPNFFLAIFLVKSKLSTAKKSKTTTFSRVFHPLKKIDNFLGKSKLNFWTKNEDFEQCV